VESRGARGLWVSRGCLAMSAPSVVVVLREPGTAQGRGYSRVSLEEPGVVSAVGEERGPRGTSRPGGGPTSGFFRFCPLRVHRVGIGPRRAVSLSQAALAERPSFFPIRCSHHASVSLSSRTSLERPDPCPLRRSHRTPGEFKQGPAL